MFFFGPVCAAPQIQQTASSGFPDFRVFVGPLPDAFAPERGGIHQVSGGALVAYSDGQLGFSARTPCPGGLKAGPTTFSQPPSGGFPAIRRVLFFAALQPRLSSCREQPFTGLLWEPECSGSSATAHWALIQIRSATAAARLCRSKPAVPEGAANAIRMRCRKWRCTAGASGEGEGSGWSSSIRF